MLPQVLRACIVDEFGEYKTLFEELVATSEPDGGVMLQASASKSPYFKLRLDQRVAELGYVTEVDEGWKRDTEHNNIVIDNDVPSRDTMLIPHMGQESLYCDGHCCSGDKVDSLLSFPEEWSLEHYTGDPGDRPHELDYVRWPPRHPEEVDKQ